MVELNKEGRESKTQKIPKEDYIFCDLCENRFSILETYCSTYFFHTFHKTNLREKFPLKKEYRGYNTFQVYRECKYLNPDIFNLFIISLLWRTSISSHKWFKGLIISELFKENMRIDLNINMKYSYTEYQNRNELYSNQENYYSYEIITKDFLTKTPESSLSVFNIQEHVIMLNLVDFSVFFFLNEESSIDFRPILNMRNSENIRVCISDTESWKKIHNTYLKKMI